MAAVRLDPWQNIVNVHWGESGPTNPPDAMPQIRATTGDHIFAQLSGQPISLTWTLPLNTVVGDLLVAEFHAQPGVYNDHPAVPAGWTVALRDARFNTFNNDFISSYNVYWKIADQAWPAQETFEISPQNGLGENRLGIVIAARIDGHDPDDPIQGLVWRELEEAFGGDITVPEITTTRDQTLILDMINVNANRPDSLFTKFTEIDEQGGSGSILRHLHLNRDTSMVSQGTLPAFAYRDPEIFHNWTARVAVQAPLTF